MILGFLSSVGKKLKKLFNNVSSSKKISKDNDQFKTEGMGVDLINYIQDADKQIAAVHDTKIKLESNLHKYLIENGQIKNEKNKGIKFAIPTDNPNITVNVLVYPKTVQIDIGCTLQAFTDDYNGRKELAALLYSIWQRLCEYSGHKAEIPEPSNWILTHYHYGKDGKMEYDGEKFHITARDALGEFIRAYSKTLLDGSTIVRIEKIKTDKITVGTFLRRNFGGRRN